ncbi:hypothetical protein ACGFWE_39435 [Streptomyces sp. NPDC048523]|uniref:hypothetical protein n=1 Tax=unclassified Streptomyces TaxID=2593676 RepID=UPI0033345292
MQRADRRHAFGRAGCVQTVSGWPGAAWSEGWVQLLLVAPLLVATVFTRWENGLRASCSWSGP